MILFKRKECKRHHWVQIKGPNKKNPKQEFIWKCSNCGKKLKEDVNSPGA